MSSENRVLMFSQRNIFEKFHYRCAIEEFEDLIRRFDAVDMLAPPSLPRFKRDTRIAQRLATDLAFAFNPGIPVQTAPTGYDLFFAHCQFPKDLLHLKALKGWQKCARLSVCWLTEIWISEIHKYRYYLDILSDFDVVVMNLSSSLQAVNKVIGDKAFFMPLGIDAVLFGPYPDPPRRVIDMYSIGRRSSITHEKLLDMAEGNRMFYVYDSIIGDRVMDPLQHRQLFANMLKRSRFFRVDPGKIDVPEERTVQSEIGNRFFEGCAAGAVMIGEHPGTPAFKEIFHWPDAVLHLPFGSGEVEPLIREMSLDTERMAAVSLRNVQEALMHHDWVYRWEKILEKAGMKPLPGLQERKHELDRLLALTR